MIAKRPSIDVLGDGVRWSLMMLVGGKHSLLRFAEHGERTGNPAPGGQRAAAPAGR